MNSCIRNLICSFLFFVVVDSQAITKDTTLKITYRYGKLKVPVTIKLKANAKANILALPGWNLLATDWCAKTSLCDKAANENYNVIMVEMQRSVYLRQYYPQTRKEYSIHPTRTWLHDSVLINLFKNKIIDQSKPMYVIGLSTGGRGAAIMALDYPEIIKGAASLSGDFDPMLQKDDNLMINSIGSFNKYELLWKGDNNMSLRAAEFKVPLYIGHGCADKVCPPIQSESFVYTLYRKNPGLKVVSNFPAKMKHDYTYWNSEVDAVLEFFNSIYLMGN